MLTSKSRVKDSLPKNYEISLENPIFLGGLDRTGKTLMRLMLTSHSNIAITRRTYLWSKYYNKFGDLSQVENFNLCLDAILGSKSIQYLEPVEESIRSEFSQGEATYARLFGIIQKQFATKMGKSRWGDQMGMIEQFSYPIISAYPRAKIIHMIRDPRDRYKEKFSNKKIKPGKFGWETERWLKSIRLAHRNLRRYPQNYHIVGYETFITNAESTLQEVCEFIEEPYEHGMLKMENAIRFGDKPIQLRINLGDAVSQHSMEAEMLLSNGELAYLQSFARSEMLNNGYTLDNVKFSIVDWIKYSLVDWPANFAGGIAYKYSNSDSQNFPVQTM